MGDGRLSAKASDVLRRAAEIMADPERVTRAGMCYAVLEACKSLGTTRDYACDYACACVALRYVQHFRPLGPSIARWGERWADFWHVGQTAAEAARPCRVLALLFAAAMAGWDESQS